MNFSFAVLDHAMLEMRDLVYTKCMGSCDVNCDEFTRKYGCLRKKVTLSTTQPCTRYVCIMDLQYTLEHQRMTKRFHVDVSALLIVNKLGVWW